MLILGILVPIAILGLLVVGAVTLFRRGGDALDLAPRNLLRFYLYVASLAGILTLVVGLSGILNAGFAASFGNGFVYGSQPVPALARPCPPNEPKCSQPDDFQDQQARQAERRRAEDLIRGITFTVFGAVFWAAHWVARRTVIGTDEGRSGLRRAYLMLGTVIFGLSTIALLPTGIYQGLSYLLLPTGDGIYRQGAGESLSGGLVTLPVWLLYLWLVVRDARSARALPATAA
ncbi:MAG TPA: hypothetical protein VM070_07570 [Candidatus Saccharimonadales bacterium]|nr:hypothetical protein [Candidatus Saccharimonadales bacterium]